MHNPYGPRAPGTDVPPAQPAEVGSTDDERRTGALEALQRGGPLRAAELLREIELPQGHTDFVLFVRTGRALQAKRDYEGAYEMYRRVWELFPKQAQGNDPLVSATHKMERQLGVSQTVLPRTANPHKGRNLGLLIAGLAVTGVVGFGIVRFFNQEVHIHNALMTPVTVEIDGRSWELGPEQSTTVRVREGGHELRIVTPHHERDRHIEVRNTLASRYLGTKVFVVSPLGAEVFGVDNLIYEQYPDLTPDLDFDVHVGEEFYAIENVDYGFGTDAPEELEITKGQSKRKRDLYRMGPDPSAAVFAWIEMMEEFGDSVPDVDFPALLETHIEHGRTSEEFLQLYVDYSVWVGREEAGEYFAQTHGFDFSPTEPEPEPEPALEPELAPSSDDEEPAGAPREP